MNADMREECLKVLNTLMSDKYYEQCSYFYGPVKDVLDEAEWKVYKSIIKNPRDLNSIRVNLEANKYSNTAAFSKDVELCFENAKKYSATRYPVVATAAVAMLKVFRNELDMMIQRLNKTKIVPSAAVAQGGAQTSINYESVCIDIIDTLKKLQSARWFLSPVDFSLLSDYESRIPHPIDLSTIRSKLQQHQYTSIEAFARDTRRVFGNCMRYHYGIIDKSAVGKERRQLRTDAKVTLLRFEQEFAKKFPNASRPMHGTRECLLAIDEVLKTPSVNPVATPLSCAMNFTHPVSFYYGGTYPEGYLEVAPAPMDIGTMISKLAECDYKNVDEVKQDINTILNNVEAYWKYQYGDEGIDQDELVCDARRLVEKFNHTLELELARVSRKEEEIAAQRPAELPKIKVERSGDAKPGAALKPLSKLDLREKLTWIVSSLKQHYVQGSYGVVYTAALFLKAVDPRHFPDYHTIVMHPMDLAQVEKKIKGERYATLSSFLADIQLIRDNCHTYNTGDFNAETRMVADMLLEQTKYLLSVIVSEIQEQFDDATNAAVLDDALIGAVKREYPKDIISFYEPYVKMRMKKPAKAPTLKVQQPTSASHAEIPPVSSRGSIGKREATPRVDRNERMPVANLKPMSKLELKEKLSWVVLCLKQHYVTGPYGAVYTAHIFSRAVDPLMFPDYPTIVKNPMDLALVEKKIKGERYTTLGSFLSDIELIRDNCHAYNTGDENIEPRILADMLFDQAKYLLSVIAKEIRENYDAATNDAVVDAPTLATITKEYKDDVVSFFAPYVRMREKKPAKVKKSLENDAELFEAHSMASDSTRTTNKARRSQGDGKRPPQETSETVEPALTRITSTYMAPTEWEEACIEVYRRVTRHEFVDYTRAKAGSITANFFVPVTEQHPSMAESYLAIVKHPMDFTIINERLLSHGFLDGEDFYLNMILVFQNAVDYNLPHKDSDYACKLVPRCQHMITYIHWLAQEYLPTVDDTGASQPEALGAIRTSLREKYRADRMTLLSQRPIEHTRECMSLLKKFENRKYAKEYSSFARPINMIEVPNYSTWVKRPMDFSTIKDKLEKDKYTDYVAFINDIRLIFSNAKKFNRNFMETDVISKRVYDAAEFFEELLDSVLHKEFTLDVAEKIAWIDIRRGEEAVIEAERQARLEKEKQEDMKFTQQEIERLKLLDRAFASEQMKSLPDAVSPAHPSGSETPSSDQKKKGVGVDRLIQTERDELNRKVVRDTAWEKWTGYGRNRPEPSNEMELANEEPKENSTEATETTSVMTNKSDLSAANVPAVEKEEASETSETTERSPSVFTVVPMQSQQLPEIAGHHVKIPLKRKILPRSVLFCLDEENAEETACKTPRRGKRKAATDTQFRKRRRDETASPLTANCDIIAASKSICEHVVSVGKSWFEFDEDFDGAQQEDSMDVDKASLDNIKIRRIELPIQTASLVTNGHSGLDAVTDVASDKGNTSSRGNEANDSTLVTSTDVTSNDKISLATSGELESSDHAELAYVQRISFANVVEYPTLMACVRALQILIPRIHYSPMTGPFTSHRRHPEEFRFHSDVTSVSWSNQQAVVAYSNISLLFRNDSSGICDDIVRAGQTVVRHKKESLGLSRDDEGVWLHTSHCRYPNRVRLLSPGVICSDTMRGCVCDDGEYVEVWVILNEKVEASITIKDSESHEEINFVL